MPEQRSEMSDMSWDRHSQDAKTIWCGVQKHIEPHLYIIVKMLKSKFKLTWVIQSWISKRILMWSIIIAKTLVLWCHRAYKFRNKPYDTWASKYSSWKYSIQWQTSLTANLHFARHPLKGTLTYCVNVDKTSLKLKMHLVELKCSWVRLAWLGLILGPLILKRTCE